MRARDYREIARNNLAGNWKISIWVSWLAALLGGQIAASNISLDIDAETILQLPPRAQVFFSSLLVIFIVLAIVQFVIGGVIRQGYASILLKQYDHQAMDAHDLFSQFSDFKRGFLLALLQGLYILGWTLLLIIPGIIATYRYAMAPFIMAENPGMRPKEALAASDAMMSGHKWKLFCLSFSFIGWSILCVFTLGIGILWLNPYVNAAYAAFYRSLQPKALPQPTIDYIPENAEA